MLSTCGWIALPHLAASIMRETHFLIGAFSDGLWLFVLSNRFYTSPSSLHSVQRSSNSRLPLHTLPQIAIRQCAYEARRALGSNGWTAVEAQFMNQEDEEGRSPLSA
jgi:hypothetical protein